MAESEIYFKIVSPHHGGKVLEAFLSHDTANASIEAFNIFTTNALLLQEKRNSDGQLWYWSGIEIKNKIHPFLGLYLNNGTIRGSYLKKLVAQRHDDSDSQKWSLRGCEFSQQGIEDYCLVPHGSGLIGLERHNWLPHQLWQVEYIDLIPTQNNLGLQSKTPNLGFSYQQPNANTSPWPYLVEPNQSLGISTGSGVTIGNKKQVTQPDVTTTPQEEKEGILTNQEKKTATENYLPETQTHLIQEKAGSSTSSKKFAGPPQAKQSELELKDFIAQLDAGASGQRVAILKIHTDQMKAELQKQQVQIFENQSRLLQGLLQAQDAQTREDLQKQLDKLRSTMSNYIINQNRMILNRNMSK